ncbi:MAG TPA: hypothetical protein VGL02_03145 [Streptomyces sp.]
MSDQSGYPSRPGQRPQQPQPGWPAQPPGPPQPAGQQQYPSQAWPPAQQGWAPPPPKKRVSTRKKLLFVLAALVVLAGGVTALALVTSAVSGPEKQAQSLAVGDCVHLTGVGKDLDAIKTDCATPGTPYVVGEKGLAKGEWGCPEGFYQLTVDRSIRGDNVALCLGINGQIGTCYGDIETKTPPPPVACASARLKITETFPKASFVDSPCAEGTEKTISYSSFGDPKFKESTICFSTP